MQLISKQGNTNFILKNTNKLVRDEIFDAAVNKTGYIQESGYNLVFINKHRCKMQLLA